VGQLGEIGEYWMGRRMSGLDCKFKAPRWSPRLRELRTDRLAPVSKFDYVLVHTGFMGSRKLSSFVCC
jgi:hypothetical protein